ncbi:hypothetical protein EXIGLDRAFT_717571 [Exidia glandulosa HHB12029]|uniref:Uncharacterized protein n=1 Tax=Exidia glandulosa HHB12029 TaxID=1314781 RepID=A0A165IAY2_EXIGL|nr:hypothetical protein EXIGLDRAFT_717571 [Exidia glandulosa HHB12029]
MSSSSSASASTPTPAFNTIMGNMSVESALAKLGLSHGELLAKTQAMRQFLSSDATFAPQPTRSFTQHASQPSLPSFPTLDRSTALARSRSLDSHAMAAASAFLPAETPSRTRKADSDVSERDSKRRRGEKVPIPSLHPSRPDHPSLPAPRRLYQSPSPSPSTRDD